MLRRLREARVSPSEFVEFCFTDAAGKPVRQGDVHRELQAFLTATRRGLVELPRDHGKSVQVCGRVVWELGHNPGLRVKLVCATDALAVDRGRFLRDAVGNPRVRLVFPHLLPGKPWAAEAFSVRRPANVIGPSVAAFGVGAGSTGARADLLVCDDIVDVRSLHSKADRDRVADYFHDNLLNLLEPDGRFWGLSTPWHADDLNARLKRNPAFAVFRRAVGPDLEPVWPQKWPRQALAERLREIGASSFARGYRLVPIDDGEVVIRKEWVKFWDGELPRSAFETVVLSVDPAVSTKATADSSAVVVLGRVTPSPLSPWGRGVGGEGNGFTMDEAIGPEGMRFSSGSLPLTRPSATLSPKGRGPEIEGFPPEIRVLEATARRVSTPDLVGLIDAVDRRWHADVIVFEANAAFAGIGELLARHARFGGRVLPVTQSRSKAVRTAAFAVPVQNGTLRLKGDGGGVDAGQRELFDEMTTFPFGPHDDLLDAAATGCEHLLGRPDPRVWV